MKLLDASCICILVSVSPVRPLRKRVLAVSEKLYIDSIITVVLFGIIFVSSKGLTPDILSNVVFARYVVVDGIVVAVIFVKLLWIGAMPEAIEVARLLENGLFDDGVHVKPSVEVAKKTDKLSFAPTAVQ